MKDKLTIYDLSSYLPYELKMFNTHNKGVYELKGIYNDNDYSIDNMIYVFKGERSHIDLLKTNFKPLLIPLSELTEQQWEDYNSIDENKYVGGRFAKFTHYTDMQNYLYSIHADVHGLIEKGFAINKLNYA